MNVTGIVLNLPEGFPISPIEVHELRKKHRFVTPISPVNRGSEPWLCFSQRGTYEFFVHPYDAMYYLINGMKIGDAVLGCELSSTPYYPFIGAVQIVAKDHTANTTFIDGAKAGV